MKTTLLVTALLLPLITSAQTLIPSTPEVEKPKAEMVAQALVDGVNAGLTDRVSRFKNLWETLWENDRAEPAEILAALGPKAMIVFQAAGAARTDLDAMAELAGTTAEALLGDAKYLTPKLPVTFHQDGTVTITP